MSNISTGKSIPSQRSGPPCTLTVVSSIYHQSANDMPVPAESKFCRTLDTDEQPYLRKVKVGEGWQKLDSGWLTECSMLLLENVPERRLVLPTEEERRADAEKVMEVCFVPSGEGAEDIKLKLAELSGPYLYFLPGESQRLSVVDLDGVYIRCRKGETRCAVSIFPR